MSFFRNATEVCHAALLFDSDWGLAMQRPSTKRATIMAWTVLVVVTLLGLAVLLVARTRASGGPEGLAALALSISLVTPFFGLWLALIWRWIVGRRETRTEKALAVSGLALSLLLLSTFFVVACLSALGRQP